MTQVTKLAYGLTHKVDTMKTQILIVCVCGLKNSKTIHRSSMQHLHVDFFTPEMV